MNFIEKFREAVRIPTCLQSDDVLTDFQEFLLKVFPIFHKTAQRWVLSPYSIVYRISGTGDAGAVLFLAHYDVVPAEKEKWSVDPFGAQVKDNFVYGRGSIDMKSTLISMLEAAENLCAQGWKPKQDIWFAFGGDEERGGTLGAMKTAQWFKERNQTFNWIMDEGTPIMENIINGTDSTFAFVSIVEKGNLSLCLTVEQQPGHASRPPKIQAAAVLGRALCRIAKKPFPYRLTRAVETFYSSIAPLMPKVQGFVMRHARILSVFFRPLFFKLVSVSPTAESFLRTTVAMTMLEGSAADNVMPSQVKAVINIRLLCPWTIKSATAYIKKIIKDERVQLSLYEPGADPVFTEYGFGENGWQQIKDAVAEVWSGVVPLPFVMVAITDSRYYKELTKNIFRFSPKKLNFDELNRVHGHDERISLENLHNELKFYLNLMRSL
jgi:carboxypeptidase PM20D1